MIESELKPDNKKIFTKPNFTSVTRQLAATHVDAVLAVLDFISKFNVKEIVIGEGLGTGDTFAGFRNFCYLKLRKDYEVELLDLNQDEYELVEILDENFNLFKIRVAKTVLEFDYRVSISPLKTHDFVILTLGLKNLVVGSVVSEDKRFIRQAISGIAKLQDWEVLMLIKLRF
ncbi:MAG: DUF362 domain-containing protein [Candidatus Thermoplasmatota archaeon]|nr:DUF362 domain-containing protein [Candidatus Thermoplasmatota archaeon]